LNSATYNGQENVIYGSTYTPYIPFSSTSSNIKSVEYNTVKPLNADGTVSMDYTTYKGVYRPRRTESNGLEDRDLGIGELPTPIGDPDIFTITFLLILYFVCQYLKNRNLKCYY
jgi:hypothetical protein